MLIIPDDDTAKQCILSFFNDRTAADKLIAQQGDRGYGVVARIAWESLSLQADFNREAVSALRDVAKKIGDVLGENNSLARTTAAESAARAKIQRVLELGQEQLMMACRQLNVPMEMNHAA